MQEDTLRYFPEIDETQRQKLLRLKEIYDRWNIMINVISRKDMEHFHIHHVLHSLAIAKVISFRPGTAVLDAGTGGGFPGIPLSIVFPDTEFTLMDSIGKKIKVVTAVKDELGLENVSPVNKRVETETRKFHYVVSRAVTAFPEFVKLTRKIIVPGGAGELPNGILYLKGGDLSPELQAFRNRVRIWDISSFFNEPFFETKKVVYLPA